jgi:hypothetical protein
LNKSKTSFESTHTAKIGHQIITNTLTFTHESSNLSLTLGLAISSVLFLIVAASLGYLVVFYLKYHRWPAIGPFCRMETLQKTENQQPAKIGKYISLICCNFCCHYFPANFLFYFALELKPFLNKELVQANEELSPITRSKLRCLVEKDDFALTVCEEYIR